MAKQGRTISELAAELERQVAAKKDYLAPADALTVRPNDTNEDVVIDGLNGASYPITAYAHGQVAEYVGIPKAYYDRTRAEHPMLLAENVNTWLRDKSGDKRLVRTLDGNVRAFLSDRYRPLENADLAQAVLPKLVENSVQIISAEITETRLYIKGILPSLSESFDERLENGGRREAVLISAITISNSEVGAGALRIEPSVFTTYCRNLAVVAAAAMKKYHVGRGLEVMEDFSIFTDATRKQDDLAFWMKVQDTVGVAFNADAFHRAIESIRGAHENRIESDNLAKVVEVATKRFALPDGLRNNVLTALAAGNDLSQWGLSQAFTNVANNVRDYELATELEHVGGKVIALPATDWKAIATAA